MAKTRAEIVGNRIMKFPGEWVVVDGDRSRVVSHDLSLERAVEQTPKTVKRPQVYFSAPAGAPRVITVAL